MRRSGVGLQTMSPLENTLDSLLESYRSNAISERDKGTAFEKLVAAWRIADPVQARRFERVELWSEQRRRGSGAASWYDSRVIRDGYRPWGAA